MPVSILIVVDFPAPFGPMNATRSPGFTEKEIPFTATISLVSGENKFFNQLEDAFLAEKENFFVRFDTVMEFEFINYSSTK
jgi:hypothetical protein